MNNLSEWVSNLSPNASKIYLYMVNLSMTVVKKEKDKLYLVDAHQFQHASA